MDAFLRRVVEQREREQEENLDELARTGRCEQFEGRKPRKTTHDYSKADHLLVDLPRGGLKEVARITGIPRGCLGWRRAQLIKNGQAKRLPPMGRPRPEGTP
jgi:hypothetical protein